MLETFAPHRLADEHIFKNRHPSFGLPAASLQLLELPGTTSLFELLRGTRTDSIVNLLILQRLLIGLTVKAAVCPDFFEHGPKDCPHLLDTALQQSRVCRCRFS